MAYKLKSDDSLLKSSSFQVEVAVNCQLSTVNCQLSTCYNLGTPNQKPGFSQKNFVTRNNWLKASGFGV
ncbi:hypothetical protein [Microcoleus sp. CAWBG58]|uniref:hypothetical protein n=1 Tax=Microcoleus sp. CAWBG58 TaxID=2841651 RepID=UPI0025F944AA|nr:hypothetical protein [Microcoleus sp. CAWBG58]